MKKVLGWMLCAVLAVLMLQMAVDTATAGAEDATEYDCEIASYAQLLAFAERVNSGETSLNAILTADIVVTAEECRNAPWMPIGRNESYPYIGTFNGNGKKIIGLTLDKQKDFFVGLFGVTASGAKIHNVGLENAVFLAESEIGGIIGYNKGGTVLYCCFSGVVEGKRNVGGVVGFNKEGGLVSNCYNIGMVTGETRIGGVVGNNFGTVSNCYNTGAVDGTEALIGGVVGWNSSTGSVTNCYNTGNLRVAENTREVGGVVGASYTSGGAIVSNCYYDKTECAVSIAVGREKDSETVKGLTTDEMTGSDAMTHMVFENSSGEGNAWMVRENDEFYSYYPCLKGFYINESGEPLSPGEICKTEWTSQKLKDGVTEISNYDELKQFAAEVNGGLTSLKGILTNDIDASASANGDVWTPIGLVDPDSANSAYIGIFDGNGKKIVGLTYIAPSGNSPYYFVGLFGYVESEGVVRNVCLQDGTIKGNYCAGGVVGLNAGTVINCCNTDAVSADNIAGGVVGQNAGTIRNCYNTGAVTGDFEVGGVVGENDGTTESCYNTGSVSGLGEVSLVGGVAGVNFDATENCYNIGAVSGTKLGCTGGVVGNIQTGKVTNCFSIGTVSAPDSENIGGVVGSVTSGTAENCFFDKSVSPVGAVKGYDDRDNNVIGLTTAKMTGISSDLGSLQDAEDAEGESVWLFKENADGAYYYPLLAGFYRDANGEQIPADQIPSDAWGNKVVSSVSLSGYSAVYTGEAYKPDVTEVILDNVAQTGYKVTYFNSSDQVVEEPTNADVYRVYVYWEEGGKPGLEKSFEILPKSVTLTAKSETLTYNGSEQTVSGFDCSVEGLSFTGVSVNGSGTKIGEYEVTLTGVSIDNTKDTTGNYVVTETAKGTLTIEKKAVSIIADSDEKECDGTDLIKDSSTSNGLADGDSIESVTVTGSQSGPGSSDNTPSSAKIVNAAGEDVTDCYDITYVSGKLTIADHSFDQEKADDQYLKTAADCTHKAVYYKSCACGEKGTETFESGEPLGHDHQEVAGSAKAATCKEAGKEADRKCTRCGDVITGAEIAKLSHTFDREVVAATYLKSEATCTTAAVYYKSCVCGEKGTETFESGEALGHDYQEVAGTAMAATCKDTGKEVDRKCSRCGDVITGAEIAKTSDHQWRAATGYEPKTCEICGLQEGDVIRYLPADGSTLEHVKGSTESVTVTYHRSENDAECFSHYVKTLIDGTEVTVIARSGSTIITLDADTLNALSVGAHTITVEFDDWKDELTLSIKAPEEPEEPVDGPSTGDTGMLTLWILTAVIAAGSIGGLVAKKQKRA